MLKIRDWCMIYHISKRRSDFSISRGFHFRKTLHLQSFAKIKHSQKFLNLQHIDSLCYHALLTLMVFK